MTADAVWSRAVRLFDAAGIVTPPWAVVGSLAEAEAALDSLALPVAVKVVPGAGIDHKTELGLVEIGVTSREMVLSAVARMLRDAGGVPLLLQEMFASHVEMVLTVHYDADFGSMVAFGQGGRYVEVLNDTVHLLPPVSEAEAFEALHRLRMWPLLEEFRGYPARDVRALVRAISSVGDIFDATAGGELEINPLLIGAQGEGVVAVDVILGDGATADVPAAD